MIEQDMEPEEASSRHQELVGEYLCRSQIRDMGIRRTISARLQYDLETSSFEHLVLVHLPIARIPVSSNLPSCMVSLIRSVVPEIN